MCFDVYLLITVIVAPFRNENCYALELTVVTRALYLLSWLGGIFLVCIDFTGSKRFVRVALDGVLQSTLRKGVVLSRWSCLHGEICAPAVVLLTYAHIPVYRRLDRDIDATVFLQIIPEHRKTSEAC